LLPTLHQLSEFVSNIVTPFAPLLNDGTPQVAASRPSAVGEFKAIFGDEDDLF